MNRAGFCGFDLADTGVDGDGRRPFAVIEGCALPVGPNFGGVAPVDPAEDVADPFCAGVVAGDAGALPGEGLAVDFGPKEGRHRAEDSVGDALVVDLDGEGVLALSRGESDGLILGELLGEASGAVVDELAVEPDEVGGCADDFELGGLAGLELSAEGDVGVWVVGDALRRPDGLGRDEGGGHQRGDHVDSMPGVGGLVGLQIGCRLCA